MKKFINNIYNQPTSEDAYAYALGTILASLLVIAAFAGLGVAFVLMLNEVELSVAGALACFLPSIVLIIIGAIANA